MAGFTSRWRSMSSNEQNNRELAQLLCWKVCVYMCVCVCVARSNMTVTLERPELAMILPR